MIELLLEGIGVRGKAVVLADHPVCPQEGLGLQTGLTCPNSAFRVYWKSYGGRSTAQQGSDRKRTTVLPKRREPYRAAITGGLAPYRYNSFGNLFADGYLAAA
ncbi:MAG: hypothetical protein KDA71_03655, partial [Planctomycetales bacterium]|nr:hypothetical protein [Planctomycetales bacterium]